jgi:hypothetical protein
MKPHSAFSLGLLSGVVVLGGPLLRADDQPPPPPPTAPSTPTAPGDTEQPTPTPPARHRGARPMGYSLADLTQKLTLSADQQKTVGGIIDNGSAQAKAIRADDSLSESDRREKLRAIFKAEHDDIRATLTADQQKTFDALPGPGGGRHKQQNSN